MIRREQHNISQPVERESQMENITWADRHQKIMLESVRAPTQGSTTDAETRRQISLLTMRRTKVEG